MGSREPSSTAVPCLALASEAGLQSDEPGMLPGLETAVGVAGISTRSLPFCFWTEKGHFATICVLG